MVDVRGDVLLFRKKVKTAQIQIAISQGLIGIFACGFLRYDP